MYLFIKRWSISITHLFPPYLCQRVNMTPSLMILDFLTSQRLIVNAIDEKKTVRKFSFHISPICTFLLAGRSGTISRRGGIDTSMLLSEHLFVIYDLCYQSIMANRKLFYYQLITPSMFIASLFISKMVNK